MRKIKFIRDYNGHKKGAIVEVTEQQSYFLLTNSIAVLSGCGADCEECEDCKGKKKKKPSAKKTVKKPKASTTK
mgnify:CR=1 FL=1|tara:strand:- start:32 stop:253 length:222 start_codon:yes stop_codon:yes gene_type:complete